MNAKEILLKLSPGPYRGLRKRIYGMTGLSQRTVQDWMLYERRRPRPTLLLLTIIDVLSDRGIAAEVVEEARARLK